MTPSGPRAAAPRTLAVLFLCTRNSARSQIAEALMDRKVRQRCPGRFEVASAGASPGDTVHSLAVEALADQGITWTGRRPKSIEDVAGQPWDLIITVCDRAKESCPVFPGTPAFAHWGMEDPSDVAGETEVKRRAFRATVVHLERRIDLLLALPFAGLARDVLAARVQAIAAASPAPGPGSIVS